MYNKDAAKRKAGRCWKAGPAFLSILMIVMFT